MEMAPSIKIKVMVFPSNSGGRDHYVEVRKSLADGLAGPSGTVYVDCGCIGGRNYWGNLQRGVHTRGCHAMVDARKLLEIPAPLVGKFRTGPYAWAR